MAMSARERTGESAVLKTRLRKVGMIAGSSSENHFHHQDRAAASHHRRLFLLQRPLATANDALASDFSLFDGTLYLDPSGLSMSAAPAAEYDLPFRNIGIAEGIRKIT